MEQADAPASYQISPTCALFVPFAKEEYVIVLHAVKGDDLREELKNIEKMRRSCRPSS